MLSQGENGVERLELVFGGENRTADEPLGIGAFGDEAVELFERLSNGVGLAVVLGERKEGRGITTGDPGNEGVDLCQSS